MKKLLNFFMYRLCSYVFLCVCRYRFCTDGAYQKHGLGTSLLSYALASLRTLTPPVCVQTQTHNTYTHGVCVVCVSLCDCACDCVCVCVVCLHLCLCLCLCLRGCERDSNAWCEGKRGIWESLQSFTRFIHAIHSNDHCATDKQNHVVMEITRR